MSVFVWYVHVTATALYHQTGFATALKKLKYGLFNLVEKGGR